MLKWYSKSLCATERKQCTQWMLNGCCCWIYSSCISLQYWHVTWREQVPNHSSLNQSYLHQNVSIHCCQPHSSHHVLMHDFRNAHKQVGAIKRIGCFSWTKKGRLSRTQVDQAMSYDEAVVSNVTAHAHKRVVFTEKEHVYTSLHPPSTARGATDTKLSRGSVCGSFGIRSLLLRK